MTLSKRKLGSQGLEVSAIGLGCMPMSQSYGPADEQESIATLHRAIEIGCTFFDTAQGYGPLTNEELLGRAFKDRRDQVVIGTKFGFRFKDGKQVGAETASRPEYIREAVEGSPIGSWRLLIAERTAYRIYTLAAFTDLEERASHELIALVSWS